MLRRPGRIRKSFHKAATYTLLDAAALASTAPLDLSNPATAPDFVALSFYKIFGFPNIGALIVRKDSAHVLESRKFFGGGTVEMVISINDTWHVKKDTSIHDRLEDGTLPFHSIFALDHAISVHERLYGPNPMKFISNHTAKLGKLLFDGLSALQHSNGTNLCRIYKDEAAVYGDPTVQGATVAFNVQSQDGNLVGFEEVEEAANKKDIYVRSGSLCNPGGTATYLNWSPAEMKAAYAAGHRCSNPAQIMLGKATGVVRVSLGAMSTTADVYALLGFLEDEYLRPTVQASMQSEPIPSTVADESWSGANHRYTQLPVLSIPPAIVSLSKTPSAPASSAAADTKAWDDGISNDTKSKPPPFNPTDILKHRKPWEEEMRRNAAAYAMDNKAREMEDTSTLSKGHTPSVKARRFGRSVVSLWRTKKYETNCHLERATC